MICKHYVNEITYFLVSFRVSNYRTRNQLVLTFISSQLFWGAKEETFMIICLKQKDAKINSKRSIFCCKKFSYFLYSYLMQWITVLSYSYRYCIQAIKTWLISKSIIKWNDICITTTLQESKIVGLYLLKKYREVVMLTDIVLQNYWHTFAPIQNSFNMLLHMLLTA